MKIHENQQKTIIFTSCLLGKNGISAKQLAEILIVLRKNYISTEKIAEIPICLRSSEVRQCRVPHGPDVHRYGFTNDQSRVCKNEGSGSWTKTASRRLPEGAPGPKVVRERPSNFQGNQKRLLGGWE